MSAQILDVLTPSEIQLALLDLIQGRTPNCLSQQINILQNFLKFASRSQQNELSQLLGQLSIQSSQALISCWQSNSRQYIKRLKQDSPATVNKLIDFKTTLNLPVGQSYLQLRTIQSLTGNKVEQFGARYSSDIRNPGMVLSLNLQGQSPVSIQFGKEETQFFFQYLEEIQSKLSALRKTQ